MNELWRFALEGLEFTNYLIDKILDKKGSDILLLDVREQAIFADYFLICNGDNDRQIKAMVADITSDAKKETQNLPLGVEGKANGGWVLIDYGPVLVHIFDEERRDYYKLEELWRDAHVVVRMQ